MSMTLSELSALVGGEVVGDGTVILTGVAGIREASRGELTFLSNPKYEQYMASTKASAVVVGRAHSASGVSMPLLVVDDAYAAFARAMEILVPCREESFEGVDDRAVVDPSATLGERVSIGPNVVVMMNVRVGHGSVLHPGVYLGQGVSIGRDCVVHSNVTLKAGCWLGDRVIIHSGTVVGTDGFGFALGGTGCDHRKVPQLGTVVIEDDVEVGSNVCIDRATIGETRIGRGTKIDNLVQIGHNVVVGEGSIIVAQVGISGSTEIGSNVVLAGQAGVAGHLAIGDGAVVGAQSGVTGSIPAGAVVSGYPARGHRVTKRLIACVQGLPTLFRRVRELERRMRDLEEE